MLSGLRPTAVFYPGRLFLPISTSDFASKLFEREGISLPGSVDPISMEDEKLLEFPLLAELSTKYKLSMDTMPNLSRELVLNPKQSRQDDEIPALFIERSNADKLANVAATLGVLSDTITEGGLEPHHLLLLHHSAAGGGLLRHSPPGGSYGYLLPR
jgi:hypothetical protein